MLDGLWAEVTANVSIADDPDANITGNVLTFGSAQCRYVLPSAQNTVGIGTRVWLDNIPVSNAQRPAIQQWRDGSNNCVLAVFVSPTGSLQVYRDIDYTTGAGTLIGATSGPVMTAQAWRHIETKVFWSTTVGTVQIKIEGVSVLSLTGVNTGAANYAQVAIGTSYSLLTITTGLSIKDVTFWDGSGSENTTFLGPCGVYRLTPNADVSSGWTRTTGSTDYGLVDEAPPNDADYIYAGEGPIPAASIMGMTNLPADIVGVRGLISVGRLQKSDGGDGMEQTSMSPNGTDWDTGTDNAISTAFSYYADVSEVSPDTAAAWTPTEVNALQVRLNRTT
tara:strand:- start:56 stop:1060 length:1005 start_codon:yes stop_codon:yes gene_type:complete